jgi:MoxR-like ATPase
VIVGKREAVSLVLTGFIAGGHILLEDVPGTGKTMLCRAFAKAIGGAGFKRVQFTPDLLPSDLTGIHFYNQQAGSFEFRPGPLFTNILLGDEINRATPRTQSALLEAMEERQITVDGETMPLPGIFIVLATQNPIESYGTFPLPEAQLDRFFMRLSLGYMERGDEKDVIARRSTTDIIERLTPAVNEDELNFLKESFHEVTVGGDVLEYLMEIITRTRTESNFITGVSTRGAQAL